MYDWQLGANGEGSRLLHAPELAALGAKTLALRTNYRMEPERLLPFAERVRRADSRRGRPGQAAGGHGRGGVLYEAGWMEVDDAVAEVRRHL